MKFHLISQWITSLNSVTLFSLTTILLTILCVLVVKRIQFIQKVDKIPGLPGGITILGNAAMLLVSPEEVFNRILAYVTAVYHQGPVVRVWGGPFPMFFVFTPEAFEVILSSNKLIDKSREYDFLHPWLNTGLLTSTGSKWSSRRKLLTPTFHFKILEDFVHVFNEQSQLLVDILNESIENKKNEIDIYPFITRCTLDIICETAMGCKIQAQTHIDGDYVQAVYSMCRILQSRTIRPWLQSNFLFQLSPSGAQQRQNLKILHGFTDSVIRNKKLERKEKEKENKSNESLINNPDDLFPKKKRLAFLDLLIDASEDGKVLNDGDIREEVDTFMFEGHDTTTAAVNWSLHLISSHPDVQERVNEELDSIFGDSDRPATMTDISQLKYLECCIKEALRLYPSVPTIGRKLNQDTVIHGYTIPANSTVLLFTYLLHRDPKYFPDPEIFRPERFFEENNKGRHPYSYVPFSAGPRNCIGQKFAMMEEKVILSSIFRNFHLEALEKREELIVMNDVILRPLNGIRLRLIPKHVRVPVQM